VNNANTDWLVYILKCSDDTLYTGITNNLNKRLRAHNSKKGAKYTRSRVPVVLMACKDGFDRSEASKMEHKIKKLSREQKFQLIKDWSMLK
jgi:putative endonuclease